MATHRIGREHVVFAMDPATIGIIITLTQIGYGVGLLLLVPLGDLLNRRRLIVLQTLLSALALLMIALAPSSTWLLLGMALTGLLAVVTQVLVAYAATLDPFERILRRMAGLDDGIGDALLKMSRAVTGGYFWCPPVVAGNHLDLRALGL